MEMVFARLATNPVFKEDLLKEDNPMPWGKR
jgi:hypothetical protein